MVSASRRAGVPSIGLGTLTQSSARAERRRALGLQVEAFGIRQQNRQLVLGHRNLGAVCAVDDRDGRAPVALARDEPVAQAVVLGGAAAALCREDLDDLLDRVRLRAGPSSGPGVHQAAVAGEGDAGDGGVGALDVGQHGVAVLVDVDHGDDAGHRGVHVDDDAHGQVEGAGEVEVALVVGGHGHDGAVTVVGQHVVGGPDRQRSPLTGLMA